MEEIRKDLRVLTREHSLEILEQISKKEVMSSSEIVVESHVQPSQVYRVLTELEKANLIEKEKKPTKIKEPYVFWRLTNKGRIAKRLVEDYHRRTSV